MTLEETDVEMEMAGMIVSPYLLAGCSHAGTRRWCAGVRQSGTEELQEDGLLHHRDDQLLATLQAASAVVATAELLIEIGPVVVVGLVKSLEEEGLGEVAIKLARGEAELESPPPALRTAPLVFAPPLQPPPPFPCHRLALIPLALPLIEPLHSAVDPVFVAVAV